ncbi:MAG: hypothetical protein ACK559_39675 [bacterium]
MGAQRGDRCLVKSRFRMRPTLICYGDGSASRLPDFECCPNRASTTNLRIGAVP